MKERKWLSCKNPLFLVPILEPRVTVKFLCKKKKKKKKAKIWFFKPAHNNIMIFISDVLLLIETNELNLKNMEL